MTAPSYHRMYLRYPMHYPVIFGWASCVGEGLLTNLSFSGCSVSCDRTPLVGAEVCMSLLLPDHRKAFAIEGGMVKWAEGRLFGVEFERLPVDARQRLNRTLRRELIRRLEVRSHGPGQSTMQGVIPRHQPI